MSYTFKVSTTFQDNTHGMCLWTGCVILNEFWFCIMLDDHWTWLDMVVPCPFVSQTCVRPLNTKSDPATICLISRPSYNSCGTSCWLHNSFLLWIFTYSQARGGATPCWDDTSSAPVVPFRSFVWSDIIIIAVQSYDIHLFFTTPSRCLTFFDQWVHIPLEVLLTFDSSHKIMWVSCCSNAQTWLL